MTPQLGATVCLTSPVQVLMQLVSKHMMQISVLLEKQEQHNHKSTVFASL